MTPNCFIGLVVNNTSIKKKKVISPIESPYVFNYQQATEQRN